MSKKMSKKQFESMFKQQAIPLIIDTYEKDGVPDKPARREAWNNLVDASIRDGVLPRSAGNWSHPGWLESYRPRGRSTNPPPSSRSRGVDWSYGVYNPNGEEEFYDDVNVALSRAAFLSGINNGDVVHMRMYEGDGRGGWKWGQMFAITTNRVDYVLPEGARAA